MQYIYFYIYLPISFSTLFFLGNFIQPHLQQFVVGHFKDLIFGKNFIFSVLYYKIWIYSDYFKKIKK